MIDFVGKDCKDIKIGSKQVVKVTQGIDVKWQKEMGTLAYSDRGRSYYDLPIYSYGSINPNKSYRFVTNKPDDEYSIVVSDSYYTIKNYDVFRVTTSGDIKIRNTNYNYYDIKIYEVNEEATIVII